ncbi:hypothetical protein [Metallosphaera javensis (ex Sakai et al. 2022)]|uniref:hypothetical protein n=1 Tax=Metallosphaera javensis (ex Sakai et al. 2022) TaxID=2775498 RepID=UPI00258D1330
MTSGIVTGTQSIKIVYYHQYLVNFSYSIVGGEGFPNPPVLAGFSFGSPISVTLSGEPVAIWLDSGSSYSVTNPIVNTTLNEKWYTNTFNGTINGSGQLDIVYRSSTVKYTLLIALLNAVIIAIVIIILVIRRR